MPMGGVITTGSFPKANWPGLRGIWGSVYEEHPPEYGDLFEIVNSTYKYEEYMSRTGFGLASIKTEGNSVNFDSEVQGWIARIVNVTYGSGFIVSMEERNDNLYPQEITEARTKLLGFSMRQTEEQVAALVYNRATTSGFVGADGVVLGSAVHPNVSGGTYSNTQAVPADLSETSLEDALTQIMGLQNDRGLFISVMPLSLIVPRQLWWTANRIMKSVYQSGTGNNDINVLKSTNALPDGIKMNHYLTAPNTWFVRTKVGGGGYGMIFQRRQKTVFEQDNEFDTRNWKFIAISRFAPGWDDPRALFVAPGP